MKVCKWASVQMCMSANVQMCANVCKCANVQVCKCANVQVCKCASVQVCKCANVQVCKCANVQMCASVQVITRSTPSLEKRCPRKHRIKPYKNRFRAPWLYIPSCHEVVQIGFGSISTQSRSMHSQHGVVPKIKNFFCAQWRRIPCQHRTFQNVFGPKWVQNDFENSVWRRKKSEKNGTEREKKKSMKSTVVTVFDQL